MNYSFLYFSDMVSAFETLKNMESLDIPITIQTYSAFMYADAKRGNIKNLKKTIAQCKARNIRIPNKVLLTIAYHLGSNNCTEYIDEVL